MPKEAFVDVRDLLTYVVMGNFTTVLSYTMLTRVSFRTQ